MQKKFITCAEAAALANVTTETIRNLCKRGVLDYRMSGNFFLPAESDVKKHVKKISKIHRATSDINDFYNECVRNRDRLHELREQQREQLALMSMFPRRIQCIWRTVKALLEHYQEQMKGFTPREMYIVSNFLDGHSCTDVSDYLGISEQRVWQVYDKLLRHLRFAKNVYKQKDEQIDQLEQHIDALLEENFCLKHPDKKDEQENKDLSIRFGNFMATRLGECDLSVRALNCLKSAEIETIGDLIHCHRIDLLKFRNFGKKSLTELDEFLDRNNLCFGMSEQAAFETWKRNLLKQNN